MDLKIGLGKSLKRLKCTNQWSCVQTTSNILPCKRKFPKPKVCMIDVRNEEMAGGLSSLNDIEVFEN